jgi:hypothetical protein
MIPVITNNEIEIKKIKLKNDLLDLKKQPNYTDNFFYNKQSEIFLKEEINIDNLKVNPFSFFLKKMKSTSINDPDFEKVKNKKTIFILKDDIDTSFSYFLKYQKIIEENSIDFGKLSQVVIRKYSLIKERFFSNELDSILSKVDFNSEVVNNIIFAIYSGYFHLTKIVSFYFISMIDYSKSEKNEVYKKAKDISEKIEKEIDIFENLVKEYLKNKSILIKLNSDEERFKQESFLNSFTKSDTLRKVFFFSAVAGTIYAVAVLALNLVRFLTILLIDSKENIGISLHNVGSALIINAKMIKDEKISKEQKVIGEKFRDLANKFTNRYQDSKVYEVAVNKIDTEIANYYNDKNDINNNSNKNFM